MNFFATFEAREQACQMNKYQKLFLQKLLQLVQRKNAACGYGQNSTKDIDNSSHYDGAFT
jgi:hypothetical protein